MTPQPSLGFQTLLRKEVTRFLRVPGQTLVSPLVTTTLYFIVFGFTVNVRTPMMSGESYARFIVPGLIMLGVVSNSFLNSSSSIFVMKIQGTIVDLLVTPMTYLEILGAFVLAAVIRGLLVGVATWLVASCFTSFDVSHPVVTIVFIVLVASSFGTLGVLTGIWAEKFEQVNLIPTFLITPLTFLGGVFYSVNRLPEALQKVALANPILYMVEGVRYGILGHADVPPGIGLAALILMNGVTLFVAHRWLRSGYKLRS